MKLHQVYGHSRLLDRLSESIGSGRFPQVAMLEGPAGAGKQRIALWIAQAMLCEAGQGRPCSECAQCKQVLDLAHPDLHWITPIPRPKAPDTEKQAAEARDLLSKAIAERRENPIYASPDGMLGHPLAAIRSLKQTVSVKPYSGKVRIVVLGNAERLVVQEASQEAANALLKVLEEPPSHTVVLLTTSRPGAILPTIKSRATPIRVPRVPDAELTRFVENEIENHPVGTALEKLALVSDGSIGAAINRLAESTGTDSRGSEFLNAVVAGPAEWSKVVFGQPTFAARGAFADMLEDISTRLRAKLTNGKTNELDMKKLLEALRLVTEMSEAARTNINPQLASAALARRLDGLL